ncbi:MAG: putative oxidoreductase [Deltaproteobacteria bacterium]|nr:putative oxidoreductase [Deltaproteobacteria bacterium]
MADAKAAQSARAPHPARWDVVIVGGGPAGLATAIAATGQGLSVLVLERRAFPPDKVCGEGVLPPGVRALEHLGVFPYLDRRWTHRFSGIRFIQEDRSSIEALLPGAGGLGIRRTALVEAMTRRAQDLGAVVRHQCAVYRVVREPTQVVVHTSVGTVCGRMVVAADGLNSLLRRTAGLEADSSWRRRFALRQHFRVQPWTDLVEVYVDRVGEAVVTPVSDDCVNVNFVWEDGVIAEPGVQSLARRFPALQLRLAGAPAISSAQGAGPMPRRVTGRCSDRMALVGDAAGFVDSISGDGLSVALNSALLLGRHLPAVLADGAMRASMRTYERAARRLFRRYWLVTTGLLVLARHPRARAAAINYLATHRAIGAALTRRAMQMMVSVA